MLSYIKNSIRLCLRFHGHFFSLAMTRGVGVSKFWPWGNKGPNARSIRSFPLISLQIRPWRLSFLGIQIGPRPSAENSLAQWQRVWLQIRRLRVQVTYGSLFVASMHPLLLFVFESSPSHSTHAYREQACVYIARLSYLTVYYDLRIREWGWVYLILTMILTEFTL